MGTTRQRSRYDDEDEDDRPRRRRYDDEDEDEDDRPRSRGARDDDDDDDRPRRRRRRGEDDKRPMRRPRRKSGGPSAGLIIGIVGGVAGIAIVVVFAVILARGGFSSANISYEKFQAIDTSDSIEGLEKKFGSAKKIDPRDWGSTYMGGNKPGSREGASAGEPLSGLNWHAREVTSWHMWKKGQEEIYVAEGTDAFGRKGLVLKVYWNPKVVEEAVRNPGSAPKGVPWMELVQIGVGGRVRFGGGN